MCLLVVLFVSSYVWCVCKQLCLCLLGVMFGVFVSVFVSS